MFKNISAGTTLVSENTFLDLPTSVVTFYLDTNDPRTPGLVMFVLLIDCLVGWIFDWSYPKSASAI